MKQFVCLAEITPLVKGSVLVTHWVRDEIGPVDTLPFRNPEAMKEAGFREIVPPATVEELMFDPMGVGEINLVEFDEHGLVRTKSWPLIQTFQPTKLRGTL